LRSILKLASSAFDFYLERIMCSRWVCGPRPTTDVEREAISSLVEDSRGVTAIEYALIAALIAVAAIAAFTLVGTNLSTTFSYVASQL
jgi:pilus assembly protein Flp/PilA